MEIIAIVNLNGKLGLLLTQDFQIPAWPSFEEAHESLKAKFYETETDLRDWEKEVSAVRAELSIGFIEVADAQWVRNFLAHESKSAFRYFSPQGSIQLCLADIRDEGVQYWDVCEKMVWD